MKTNFRIVGLPLTQFEPLFSLDDSELAQKGARRLIVDAKPGFPCRVSLQDAEIGESAKEIELAPGEIPDVVTSRVMSVRAYNDKGMMVNAAVIPGKELESQIEKFFDDAKVSYLHLHNAGAGCYSCRVERS